jgi:hypothetical protein
MGKRKKRERKIGGKIRKVEWTNNNRSNGTINLG